jgi:hypothetical protein
MYEVLLTGRRAKRLATPAHEANNRGGEKIIHVVFKYLSRSLL